VSEIVDLRAQLGPVRDQGRRGTCLAFAVTTAHEQGRRRRRGPIPAELGEEILYWACKQLDSDQTPGTYPRSATHALRAMGQSAGALWPYEGTRDDQDPGYTPPPAALAAQEVRRATLSATTTSFENLCDLICHEHAVVLGLELWPQFYTAHAGALSVPLQAELLGVGHAVALVGFDEDAKALLLRNSWGEGWGQQGHATLPYVALAVACRGAWTLEDDIDA